MSSNSSSNFIETLSERAAKRARLEAKRQGLRWPSQANQGKPSVASLNQEQALQIEGGLGWSEIIIRDQATDIRGGHWPYLRYPGYEVASHLSRKIQAIPRFLKCELKDPEYYGLREIRLSSLE